MRPYSGINKLLYFIGIFLLTACTGEGNSDDAGDKVFSYDRFMEKHMAAMGGRQAIESVKTVDIELEISEPDTSAIKQVAGKAVRAHYRASRMGKMRIDVYVDGERVFTEALLSPDVGWELNGGERTAKTSSEAGRKALLNGIYSNLYGLHELATVGYRLEFQGLQQLMGKTYYAMDVTSPNGKAERQFFDPKTYLKAASMDESALHVDVDPTKTVNVSMSSDYRSVDGLMRSFSGEVIDMGQNKVIQNTKILKIEFNKELDENQFLRP
ncbi:MAG: hypothetical protein H6912_00375 [Kordiimonadaceae bacterium]|nr:hypothetical protein [Kordiimonadaceae bacterium]